MSDVRTELQVYSGNQPYTLVVEPWGDTFVINPGDLCRVVAIHDVEPAAFGIGHHPECLSLWINQGGAGFEFWRGDTRER